MRKPTIALAAFVACIVATNAVTAERDALTATIARLRALAEGLDGEASFARDDDDGTAQALGHATDAIRRAIGGER